MKPIGKTCLVECELPNNVEKEGLIYVVNDNDKLATGFWKGIIKEYGTLVTEDDLKDLPPIGTKVVMDITKKAAIKLVLCGKILYVRNVDEIIGVIEDE